MNQKSAIPPTVEVVDMMTPELEKLVDLLAHIAVDITLKETNEESCPISPLQ